MRHLKGCFFCKGEAIHNCSISEKLSDTHMPAGSEAYQDALAAYRLFGAAAKAGLNGADAVSFIFL